MQRTEDRGQKTEKRTGGFSLIEIIITLVVLSIAAVGVLSVFTFGIRGSADPLVLNQAITLAQERMDAIVGDRMNTARGFAWFAADYNTNPLKYLPETPVTGFANFNRNVSICCVSSPPPADALNDIAPCVAPGASGCASGYAHVTVTVWNAAVGNVNVEMLLTAY